MVEAIGNQVVALRRVRFGPLELGTCSSGSAAAQPPREVKRLWKDAEP